MKTQISLSLDTDTLTALRALARLERRSLSGMAALLIEQRIVALRGEYRQDNALPSLPKSSRISTRGWDSECVELFGE